MIIVGRIKENHGPDFPALRSLIGKPMQEKERIVQYLKTAPAISAAAASMKDVLTNQYTGRELLVHTDGEFLWRSDVTYYVEKYDMELPTEFVKHILEVDE